MNREKLLLLCVKKNKGIRDAGGTADFRILFEIFEILEIFDFLKSFNFFDIFESF